MGSVAHGPTFALGIPHAPWAPGRKESLERLLGELEPRPASVHSVRIFSGREPNWAWSERLWAWGAGEDATHVLVLQDDVRVPPGLFWPSLTALVTAFPAEVLGLETIHPRAAAWALGGHRAYRVRDCCIGVGYVWPRALLEEFVGWTAAALRPGARESVEPDGLVSISEDTLIGMWAHATRRTILSPLPTMIDHDLTLPSTYGHDAAGPQRGPCPTWKDWPAADLLDWSGPVKDAGWQYGIYILAMCAKYVLAADALAARVSMGLTPPHKDDAIAEMGCAPNGRGA